MATPGKLKPLTGDETRIDVIVRGHGRVFHHSTNVSSAFGNAYPDAEAREVWYQIEKSGKMIYRDLLHASQPERPTNPFSWSPGPTRWQFYK